MKPSLLQSFVNTLNLQIKNDYTFSPKAPSKRGYAVLRLSFRPAFLEVFVITRPPK